MKKGLLIFILLLLNSLSFSQSTIYSTDFGTGASLPSGWTTSSAVITPNATNPSSAYTGASGSGNLLFNNSGASGNQIININPGLNTSNYTNINVTWGGSSDGSGLFPAPLTFEWSVDGGTTWIPQSFSDIPNADGTWYKIASFGLSIGAEGKTNLQFRLTLIYDGNGGIYQMDDFTVSGTGNGSFYSKAVGNLDLLSSWGTNTDGSGTAPLNFTSNSQTFNIVNNSIPTIGANWILSGSGATVVVQNGINFTIPATFSLTTSGGAVLNVLSGGTVTLKNTSVPTFGTLQPTSTINYNGPTNVIARTYENLTTSTATTLGGGVTVNGTLLLNAKLNLGAGNTLTLNGDLTGIGQIGGSSTSNLTINGSGNLTSPISLGSFSGVNFGILTINRAASGIVSLNSSPIINNQLVLNAGILNLNSKSLTLASASIVNGGGAIRGSSTSNITFSGSGSGGNLVMDNSTAINSTLSNLSTNRTVSLGSDLIIAGTLTLNTGTYNFSVGSNTLTLNGNNINIGSPAIFTTSSSSSLVFGGSSTGVNIPASVSNLNNLTINNSSVGGVITNSNMTVGGTFTLNGNINLSQNFNLTLNGPVVQTSGALTIASGSTTSNVSYSQASNGQNVIASNYLNLTFNNFNKILPSSSVIGISGAFTSGTATGHTITGSKFSYNGSVAQTISAFNYNDLDIANSGRTITFANGTIGVANNFTTSSNTFITGSSTVDFNGASSQTIPNISYYNINVSNAGTKSLSGDLVINNDLTIAPLVTLTTTTSNYGITIAGNFINNGIFTGNSSNLTFNAATSKSIQGANVIFYDLTISNTGGILFNESDVSVGHSLSLPLSTSSLDPDGSANNKSFTLISNVSGDAFIAKVPNVSASIIGNMNIQRYLPNPVALKKYRYLASPVTNATVSQWQTLTNAVTGIFANPSTGVFDGSAVPSGSPSLYYYDETLGTLGKDLNEGYVPYPGSGINSTDVTNALLQNGKGYATYIYASANTTPNVTLNLYGTPVIGAVAIPYTKTNTTQGPSNDGWNLLGNPYASPISWDSISPTLPASLDNAIYIKDNTNVSGTIAGNYVTYVNNKGTNGFNGKLASGQAFYVHATASGTLNLSENSKTNAAATFYRTSTSSNSNLIRIKLSGGGLSDEAIVYFEDNSSDKFDRNYDAYKLKNNIINISSFIGKADTNKLSINGSPFSCIKEVSLAFSSKINGAYKLNFSDFNNFDNNVKITLFDSINNSKTDIRSNNSYNFQIDGNSITQEKTRFKIIFEKEEVAPIISQDGLTLISNNKTGNQWTKNGQPIPEATSNTYLVTQDGLYSVTTKYKGGCGATSSERLVSVTGIENNIEAGVIIYPNPVIKDLNISFKLKNSSYLQSSIYNMTGGMVFEKKLYPINYGSQFIIENLVIKSGAYVLKLSDGNEAKFIKFIKE